MTPTAVQQLKTVDEALESIRYRDWKFLVGEVQGAVYIQAVPSPGSGMPPSRLFFVEGRSTRLEAARVAFDAVKWSLCAAAGRDFAWGGVHPFDGGK